MTFVAVLGPTEFQHEFIVAGNAEEFADFDGGHLSLQIPSTCGRALYRRSLILVEMSSIAIAGLDMRRLTNGTQLLSGQSDSTRRNPRSRASSTCDRSGSDAVARQHRRSAHGPPARAADALI
jgi:hypothetical protein